MPIQAHSTCQQYPARYESIGQFLRKALILFSRVSRRISLVKAEKDCASSLGNRRCERKRNPHSRRTVELAAPASQGKGLSNDWQKYVSVLFNGDRTRHSDRARSAPDDQQQCHERPELERAERVRPSNSGNNGLSRRTAVRFSEKEEMLRGLK